MQRTLTLAALITLSTLLHAQGTTLLASNDLVPTAPAPAAPLPDAPSASAFSTNATDPAEDGTLFQFPATAGSARSNVAPKYAGIILPGQTAFTLSAGDKLKYGFVDAFSPIDFVGALVSAGYSQVVDSAPHYGQDGTAFGKRLGVASLRAVTETYATDALTAVFHDDPRYYELGNKHGFVPRALYAATRVVVTRSDSGHQTLNAPLLIGYAGTAALNNVYYPDRDTGAKQSAEAYAGSLGGAALGFVVSEFIDDTLRAVHLRK